MQRVRTNKKGSDDPYVKAAEERIRKMDEDIYNTWTELVEKQHLQKRYVKNILKSRYLLSSDYMVWAAKKRHEERMFDKKSK